MSLKIKAFLLIFIASTHAHSMTYDSDVNSIKFCNHLYPTKDESLVRECLLKYYNEGNTELILSSIYFNLWNDVEKGKVLLFESILKGNLDAQVRYAGLLYIGQYFEQKKRIAKNILYDAYEQGSFYATINLGFIFLDERNIELAEKYFLEAYEIEQVVSGSYLGLIYLLTNKKNKSLDYFHQSFKKGFIISYLFPLEFILNNKNKCDLKKQPYTDMAKALKLSLNDESSLKVTEAVMNNFQSTQFSIDFDSAELTNREYIIKKSEEILDKINALDCSSETINDKSKKNK